MKSFTIVVGVIGCKCKKYVYVVYKRIVHLSYICIYAKQQKVLKKGGVKVWWVWESCPEEVVLDCFLNKFD